MPTYGDATAEMVRSAFADGARAAVLLLRHSARTFDPNLHDLLNPLTDEGRELAGRLGQTLPAELRVRGYASPPERCVDTAQCMLDAYAAVGGEVTRVRPIEALGVFYALDQQRMWIGMREAGGLAPYIDLWAAGQVPADAMMPAPLAATLVYRVMNGRFNSLQAAGVNASRGQLDICVTHDMTVHLLRECLLGAPAGGTPVEFLDGLLLSQQADGRLLLRSQDGVLAYVPDELRLN